MKSFTIIASLFSLAAAGKTGDWVSNSWNKTDVSAAAAGKQAGNETGYGYPQSLKKPSGYASFSTPVSAQNASIATEVVYTTTTWCPVASTAVDAQGHTYTTTISTLSTVTATSYLTKPHMATQTTPAPLPQNMTTTNIVYTTTTECPVTATTVDAYGSTITKTYTTLSTVTATDCLTIPLPSKGAYATGPAQAGDVTRTETIVYYTTTECPFTTTTINSYGSTITETYSTISTVEATSYLTLASSAVAAVAQPSTITSYVTTEITKTKCPSYVTDCPASSMEVITTSYPVVKTIVAVPSVASDVTVTKVMTEYTTTCPVTSTFISKGTAYSSVYTTVSVVNATMPESSQVATVMTAPASTRTSYSTSYLTIQSPVSSVVSSEVESVAAAPSGNVVSQISDGQIQASASATVGAASSAPSSSQVMSASSEVVAASSKVQVASSAPVAPASEVLSSVATPAPMTATPVAVGTAAAPSGKVVTQIGDGQIQAPGPSTAGAASSVLSILSSTKVAVPSSIAAVVASASSNGTSSALRPSSTYTGAAGKSTVSLLSGVLAIAAAVFLF